MHHTCQWLIAAPVSRVSMRTIHHDVCLTCIYHWLLVQIQCFFTHPNAVKREQSLFSSDSLYLLLITINIVRCEDLYQCISCTWYAEVYMTFVLRALAGYKMESVVSHCRFGIFIFFSFLDDDSFILYVHYTMAIKLDTESIDSHDYFVTILHFISLSSIHMFTCARHLLKCLCTVFPIIRFEVLFRTPLILILLDGHNFTHCWNFVPS